MSTILLVGYGAIGCYVFKALQNSAHSRVLAVVCREGREDRVRAALGADVVCVNSVEQAGSEFDVLLECGGHAALAQHGPAALRAGKDVLSVSNGALADESVADALEQSARQGSARLQLLTGAIGALDALQAGSAGGLSSVIYRGRKPPKGWAGSAAEETLDLDAVSEAITHFSGSAREAAQRFPKNANVAATVALAGIGLDKTTVELIVDPDISANRHEVEATGEFGRFRFAIEGNALAGNPRSSALTAMSVVSAVNRRNAPVSVD